MANQPDKHQRSVLPIPGRAYTGLIKYDAKDPEAKFPAIEPLRPPEGAPNVLVILQVSRAGVGDGWRRAADAVRQWWRRADALRCKQAS